MIELIVLLAATYAAVRKNTIIWISTMCFIILYNFDEPLMPWILYAMTHIIAATWYIAKKYYIGGSHAVSGN